MRFAVLATMLLFRSLVLGQAAKDQTLRSQHPTRTSTKAMPKSGVPASAVQTKGNSSAKELLRIEQESVKPQAHTTHQRPAAATPQVPPQRQGKNKRINATYRPPGQGQKKTVK